VAVSFEISNYILDTSRSCLLSPVYKFKGIFSVFYNLPTNRTRPDLDGIQVLLVLRFLINIFIFFMRLKKKKGIIIIIIIIEKIRKKRNGI